LPVEASSATLPTSSRFGLTDRTLAMSAAVPTAAKSRTASTPEFA
jgi:hypothetical protein